MNENCLICLGVGWVCENHIDKPWCDDLGCTCGAGLPCECNVGDEPGIDEVDIRRIFQETFVTKH
jgi:hypothetical protein